MLLAYIKHTSTSSGPLLPLFCNVICNHHIHGDSCLTLSANLSIIKKGRGSELMPDVISSSHLDSICISYCTPFFLFMKPSLLIIPYLLNLASANPSHSFMLHRFYPFAITTVVHILFVLENCTTTPFVGSHLTLTNLVKKLPRHLHSSYMYVIKTNHLFIIPGRISVINEMQ